MANKAKHYMNRQAFVPEGTPSIMQTEELKVYKWKSLKMGNVVTNFREVIKQVWICLIHFHTIDIRWQYNRNGF